MASASEGGRAGAQGGGGEKSALQFAIKLVQMGRTRLCIVHSQEARVVLSI